MKDTNTRHESNNAPQPVRVPLGNIYTTPGAQDAFTDAGEAPLRYRHAAHYRQPEGTLSKHFNPLIAPRTPPSESSAHV
jgi:hypothetical protein